MHWFAHGRRRPIAYSTTVTSTLIGMLAREGHTFASARAAIRFDTEGQAVLDAYIARGLGDAVMSEYGVRA